MKKVYYFYSFIFSCFLFTVAGCGSGKDTWYEQVGRSSHEESRFYNGKYAAFPAATGDILVYSGSTDSLNFDFNVSVLRYDSAIKLSYEVPQQSKSGTIDIPVDAARRGTKYDTLPVGSTELKNQAIFWLSKKNFEELDIAHYTKMDLGDGLEGFERGNTGPLTLKVKGKDKLVTVFNVNNKPGKTAKTFMVLTDHDNPLIVKMNGNWNYTLKEVR